MFGSIKSTDKCYQIKTNEHSNVTTFVRALIYIGTIIIDYRPLKVYNLCYTIAIQ